MKLLTLGSLFAALAVILGAFAAHALKAVLDTYQLAIFETGVRYQFYHSIALLLVGILQRLEIGQKKALQRVGVFFLLGIICFSGSLYLLACRSLLGADAVASIAGPITPIGGVFFIVGWSLLAYQTWQER
jgi:uncharacterized membrane protein YgdD (TMEM256/DUF423 family)